MTRTAIDLFSGCGGLSEGIEQAGFEVVAAVEVDFRAMGVHRLNRPKLKPFGDVREVTGAALLAAARMKKGDLDLLAGCPPCQGFSRVRIKNKSRCAHDYRNDLVFEFLRLVEELYPKVIMLENVPLLERHWRFRTFVAAVKEMGYQCDYAVVNAADYGVPQRRKRLILMGSRLGPVSIPKKKYQRKTVGDAIDNLPLPASSRVKLHRLLAVHGEEAMARIREIPHDGGSRSALGLRGQLPCHSRKGFDGFRDIYGRMAWDDISPTLTRFCCNPSKGRFLHPDQDRAISPYEAALLQTFPRSYRFPTELGREAICSMIGEAIPPLMARRQAEYLRKHIEAYL